MGSGSQLTIDNGQWTTLCVSTGDDRTSGVILSLPEAPARLAPSRRMGRRRRTAKDLKLPGTCLVRRNSRSFDVLRRHILQRNGSITNGGSGSLRMTPRMTPLDHRYSRCQLSIVNCQLPGISNTFPVVSRASNARWAPAASRSGTSRSMRSFSRPEPIHSNSSRARSSNSSRVWM